MFNKLIYERQYPESYLLAKSHNPLQCFPLQYICIHAAKLFLPFQLLFTSCRESSYIGTTSFCFDIIDGYIFAHDGRCSDLEGQIISHGNKKFAELSKKIYTVFAGNVGENKLMCEKVEIEMKKEKVESIEGAAKLASRFYEEDKAKRSRALVFGFDEQGRNIIRVPPEPFEIIKNYAATGTGEQAALDVLNDHWKENLSVDIGYEIACLGLISAALHDRHSGGRLCVYHLSSTGVMETLCKVMHSELYYQFHDSFPYFSSKTLFAVFPSTSDVDAKMISQFLWEDYYSEEPEPSTLVNVDLFGVVRRRYQLYRIYFVSEEKMHRAYSELQQYGNGERKFDDPSFSSMIMARWPINESTHAVALGKDSKSLLGKLLSEEGIQTKSRRQRKRSK